MNKAITSTGGTKPFLRENRHQSTHTAMVRMIVPAYRETVSTLFRPLRFGTGHLLVYNNTPRVRAVFHAILVDRLIYPLVIQAAAHWKQRLAEFASVCGHLVLFLVGCSAPHLDQGQVIGPVALLQ